MSKKINSSHHNALYFNVLCTDVMSDEFSLKLFSVLCVFRKILFGRRVKQNNNARYQITINTTLLLILNF